MPTNTTICMPVEVYNEKIITAFRIAESLFKSSYESVCTKEEIIQELSQLIKAAKEYQADGGSDASN